MISFTGNFRQGTPPVCVIFFLLNAFPRRLKTYSHLTGVTGERQREKSEGMQPEGAGDDQAQGGWRGTAAAMRLVPRWVTEDEISGKTVCLLQPAPGGCDNGGFWSTPARRERCSFSVADEGSASSTARSTWQQLAYTFSASVVRSCFCRQIMSR